MANEHLYSKHADAIESVLSFIRRSHRLTADAGDEFCAFARLRLLEDDCAILRKFQGLSTFKTYLVTVLQRLFLDWRIKEWGRWRPSAEARRLGPVAIELSRLVLRDKWDYDAAVAFLAAKGAASAEECEAVWSRFKKRAQRSFVDLDAAGELADEAADPVEAEQRRARAAQVRDALRTARAALPPGDQLILKLRLESGFTVARIAKLQGEDQKALYRRYEQIYRQLRTALAELGVSAEDSRAFFGQFDDEDTDAGPVIGKPRPGPSTQPSAGGAA